MEDIRKDFEIDETLLINFLNMNSEDKEMVRNWRNHEEVRKWMYTDHIIPIEEHECFLKRLYDNQRNSYWLVKNKNGDYLGVVSLNKIDLKNRNAYFAIYANPFSKIIGIGRILDKISLALAFNQMGLHTLKLEVIENNLAVINLHRKYGFKEEGRLKQFVFKNGKWQDVLVMGVVNSDLENRNDDKN